MKKVTLFALVVWLLAFNQLAFAQEDICFTQGGVWDTEHQNCLLQNALEIQITYPMELIGSPFAQDAVNEFFNARRTEFATFFVDSVNYISPGPWSLYIDYEIYAYSENIFTYTFTISDYTGGAHPNLYFHTMTFDFESETILTLDDLFTETATALSIISPIVQADLLFQQGDFADPQWIATGASEDPINYQNFAMDWETLYFFFPPYQVAPYAAGPFTVEIPLADIQNVLSDKLQ